MPIVAAPFAGSVLGVLVRRLPHGRPVAFARSCCEACGRPLGPAELVPLLSYAMLRGRCLVCRAPIAPMHWMIELSAVVPAALAVLAGSGPGRVWADCLFGWTLLALGWIDLEHGRLPDVLTLPLLLLGLAATAWLDPAALTGHALGAAAGYLGFRAVAWAYRAARGREGLGAGDAKLLAACGAWTGWQPLDLVVLGGAVATLGLALWLGRRNGVSRETSVPFGPGLALAAFAVRLHG